MDRAFTSHGGEILQKLVQSLPAFQIVQQSLEGDTRASENGGAPEDIWVSGDGLIGLSRHICTSRNFSKFTPTAETQPILFVASQNLILRESRGWPTLRF